MVDSPVSACQVVQGLGVDLAHALPEVDGEGWLDVAARCATLAERDACLGGRICNIHLDGVGQSHICVSDTEASCGSDCGLHIRLCQVQEDLSVDLESTGSQI